MQPIKELIEKKKYNNVPCPQCGEDQGYFQLVDRVNKFNCACCHFSCNAKNYQDLRKEYHQAHQDDLEVVEIDVERI